MSWTIMDGMRLKFQRVQELDLKELRSDACRLIEEDQGGGAPAEDAPSGIPSGAVPVG
jgi:hypothetical protein